MVSVVRRLWERAVGSRSPSPRAVLEAHIHALAEGRAFGPQDHDDASHRVLSTPESQDRYRVVIESGFSRIEVSFESGNLTTRLFGDSLLDSPELSPESRVVLTATGFARRGQEPHFDHVQPHRGRGDVVAAAGIVEAVLEGVCQRPSGEFYSVAIERARKPRNNELIQAIRQLVNDQSMEARRVVYQEIVNGTFLLALAPYAGSDMCPPLPDSSEPALNGRACWAIFSDYGALRTWRDVPEPYLVTSGYRIVQIAHRRRIGAMKINPKSKVGGELYGTELETIATALKM